MQVSQLITGFSHSDQSCERKRVREPERCLESGERHPDPITHGLNLHHFKRFAEKTELKLHTYRLCLWPCVFRRQLARRSGPGLEAPGATRVRSSGIYSLSCYSANSCYALVIFGFSATS